jgi:uncharacterized protein DUF4262/uncharacterized protein DUF4265
MPHFSDDPVERAAEEKCIEDVERYDLHVMKIQGDDEWPEFTYSVGLYQRFGLPEVIIVGLRRDLAHPILNELAARARSGYRYKAGDRVAGLIEGFDMEFRPIAKAQIEPHFGWARWFYDFEPFPVLQLVFPTTAGVWPWDPNASEYMRKTQPLLETAPVPNWARRGMSADDWKQMRFMAADGHAEVLWVQPAAKGTYRVLSVPVWQYGVSVNSMVKARDGERWLEFDSVVEESSGATIRVYVPSNARITPASRLYLERIVPDCRDRGIGIGPATFFDPGLVAIHVQDRSDWSTRFAEYLDALTEEGLLQVWEVGDPDAYPSEEPEERGEHDELIHPRPTRTVRI